MKILQDYIAHGAAWLRCWRERWRFALLGSMKKTFNIIDLNKSTEVSKRCNNTCSDLTLFTFLNKLIKWFWKKTLQ